MNGNQCPGFNITDIEAAEAQAEKDRQTALEVFPQIQSAISWLERASGASREAREKLREKITETQQFLSTHLRHEALAVRRAVWRALLEFELTRPLDSREEVEKLLTGLVKRGFLTEDPEGYLKAYGKAYCVRVESQFGDPEITEVKRNLQGLLRRVKEEFLTWANLPLGELFEGRPGEYAVEVPPEKVKQNGNDVWHGGGVLHIKSDGGYITPLEAMGAIEGGVRVAKELGVKLLVKSLKSNQPPFIERLDAERGGKIRLLWWLLKRAKRLDDEKKTLPTKATVSREEFFLQGKLGTCLSDFAPDVWEVTDRGGKVTLRIHSMFFLVERREIEGIKRIRIVEVPNHLVDFFGPCMAEHEEGNKFEGCPQPLRAVLQAMSGQTYRAARASQRADRIATTV